MEWQMIATAPFDRDLELAVFDKAGRVHALVFPCRRNSSGVGSEAETKKRIDVHPTHWREWRGGSESLWFVFGSPDFSL